MRPGDSIPDVATIKSCGFVESLEEVAKISDWKRKRKNPGEGRGVGIGCYSFISGGVFNWFNTQYAFSAAEVRAYADGTAHLFTMASDIGQGSDTVLMQILAGELGIGMEDVQITAADTAMTPKADLGTWGSRVTLMAGNAVLSAAKEIKRELFKIVSLQFDLNVIHEMECKDGHVRPKARPDRAIPFGEAVRLWQKANRGEPLIGKGFYTPRDRGLVTPAFSFGAQVAEIRVDKETGVVKVENMYTAHDCGKVINPMSVEGQLEGSIHMGLGYALCEELKHENGRVVNTNFLDYKILSASDMPPGESVCIDTYEPDGPFGAKEAGKDWLLRRLRPSPKPYGTQPGFDARNCPSLRRKFCGD